MVLQKLSHMILSNQYSPKLQNFSKLMTMRTYLSFEVLSCLSQEKEQQHNLLTVKKLSCLSHKKLAL